MRVIKLQNNTEHIINMHIKKRNDDIADITEIIFHEEVFLPYFFNQIENKTLFHILEDQKFKGLLTSGGHNA